MSGLLGLGNTIGGGGGLLGTGTIGSTGVTPMSQLTPPEDTNIFKHKGKAVLIVMKPSNSRKITDQAHRSNLFRFSNRFAQDAAEVIGSAVHDTSRSARDVIGLATGASARNIVLPSDDPDTIIRASNLSENYQFVLSINENGGGVGTNLSAMQEQRTIITGYFLDDPFSNTFGTRLTPNPNATMVFTHRTIVGKMRTLGHSGEAIDKFSTYADLHCIDPAQMRGLVDRDVELHFVDADTCYKTVDASDRGSTFHMPGIRSALDNFDTPQARSVIEDRPINAVGGILKCVFQGHEQVSMESVLSSYGGSEGFLHPRATSDSLRRAVGANFSSRNQIYSSGNTPKENEIWHLKRLIQTYPGVDIVPINIEGAYMFSAANQSTRSAENVFSALLCSSVPAIMVDAGLGTLAFTATVKDNGPMDEKCFYEITTREPLAVIPQQSVDMRAKAVMTNLVQGEFEAILTARGPFTVSAKFNLSGRSQVLINFLDNTQANQTPYEVPTILSGIITPNLGTAPSHGHNSEQVNHLMGVLLGDDVVETRANIDSGQSGLLGNQSSAMSVGSVLGGGISGGMIGGPKSPVLGAGVLGQSFQGGAGVLGGGNNGLGLTSGVLGTNRRG